MRKIDIKAGAMPIGTCSKNLQEAAEYLDEIYLTTDYAAELLGFTPRNVRKAISKGRIPAEKAKWGKRFTYQIPLSALPYEAKIKYFIQSIKVYNSEFDAAEYKERCGEDGLKKLLERFNAILIMKKYKKNEQGGICEKRDKVAKEIGISAARLAQLEKAYEKQGLKGIAESAKRSDEGSVRSMCLMAQDYVKAECRKGHKPAAEKIFESLKKIDKRLGQTACKMCPYNTEMKNSRKPLHKGSVDKSKICLKEKAGMKLPKSRSTISRYIKNISKYTESAKKQIGDKSINTDQNRRS